MTIKSVNTEKLILIKIDKDYVSGSMKFRGTLKEAKQFAADHNFAGGVELYDNKTKTFKKV